MRESCVVGPTAAAAGVKEYRARTRLDTAEMSGWVWHIKVILVIFLESTQTPFCGVGWPSTGRNFYT